jgi:hypothetical protein
MGWPEMHSTAQTGAISAAPKLVERETPIAICGRDMAEITFLT